MWKITVRKTFACLIFPITVTAEVTEEVDFKIRSQLVSCTKWQFESHTSFKFILIIIITMFLVGSHTIPRAILRHHRLYLTVRKLRQDIQDSFVLRFVVISINESFPCWDPVYWIWSTFHNVLRAKFKYNTIYWRTFFTSSLEWTVYSVNLNLDLFNEICVGYYRGNSELLFRY